MKRCKVGMAVVDVLLNPPVLKRTCTLEQGHEQRGEPEHKDHLGSWKSPTLIVSGDLP